MSATSRPLIPLAFTILISLGLAVSSPAKKGGNGNGGGGGGGEEPSGPVEVPAPVTYHVTWFDGEDLGFQEPVEVFRLHDVNCYGEAVGFTRRPDGFNIAVLASAADGSLRDFNDVFVDEMTTTFSEWRVNSAWAINANGQIVCKLVPHEYERASLSPVVGMAVADLTTLSIQLLSTEGNPTVEDLTENGHVLLHHSFPETGERMSLLYRMGADLAYTVDHIEVLDSFDLEWGGRPFMGPLTMNSNLQIAFTHSDGNGLGATGTKLYDYGADPATPLIDLEAGMKRKPSSRATDIGEDGTVYGRMDDGAPARWTLSAGWEPFVNVIRVSRDGVDPSVLSGAPGNALEPATVHKESDGGFFPVEVSSGDADRYALELATGLWHVSISQRSRVDDDSISALDGFICGWTWQGASHAGFILTPRTPQP